MALDTAERVLFRIEGNHQDNFTVLFNQQRRPEASVEGRMPKRGVWSARILELAQVPGWDSLAYRYRGRDRSDSGGFELGDRNQVDICIFGAGQSAEVEFNGFTDYKDETGLIIHPEAGAVFDRRITIPITAGRLYVHLSHHSLETSQALAPIVEPSLARPTDLPG